MQSLYETLLDLRATVQKEWMARETIKMSDDYKKIDVFIEKHNQIVLEFREIQNRMIAKVPNSSSAFTDAKQALFEAMKAEGREIMGDVVMKFSESNTVNKARLLEKADGDLDLILDLATFTLKGIKEFAKTTGNKAFLACIDTARIPSAIEFQL